ncbi:MAG: DUF58 domain-containing protein [Gemmobacter sp.]|uniref:DUF58 domain-containing protein n=1 Tax=Gemmobacter sp. TaxID=1898957 RepID=UPI001A430DD6|nr:DUF58 domain-containing protein [Gemmobacter sp.]MBL8562708.1 DUF58 domain-containing protein [Gemmobacter sp.]
MTSAAAPSSLRARAAALGAALPPLLAAADHLAASVAFGEHGRRRAGQGDEFWQYRQAHSGDAARAIDWRRSALGDVQYVREREWQSAQSVSLWVDASASMSFTGDKSRPAKSDRAQLLALALASLLLRGGERVGLMGDLAPPRPGRAQLERLAAALLQNSIGDDRSGQAKRIAGYTLPPETGEKRIENYPSAPDYGRPEVTGIAPHGRVVLISDFMGDLAGVEAAMAAATDRGARGVLLQVLDPAEETFPFDGRTIFTSMGGSLRFETLRAGDLRARYRARLAERRDRLAQLARAAGWHLASHDTGQGAQPVLLWLYKALEAAL